MIEINISFQDLINVRTCVFRLRTVARLENVQEPTKNGETVYRTGPSHMQRVRSAIDLHRLVPALHGIVTIRTTRDMFQRDNFPGAFSIALLNCFSL